MTRKLNRNAYTSEGAPKYLRIYDNEEETVDRYTVVFSRLNLGWQQYLAMNERPFMPQGFCQHGESRVPIDRPRYGHLGKKISFDTLNADCQRAVMQDYEEYWGVWFALEEVA